MSLKGDSDSKGESQAVVTQARTEPQVYNEAQQ